jgi:hypothetical protein
MDPSTHNYLNNIIHTSNEPTFIVAGVVLQFLDIDNPMTRIIAAQIKIEGIVGDLQSTYASHSGGRAFLERHTPSSAITTSKEFEAILPGPKLEK